MNQEEGVRTQRVGDHVLLVTLDRPSVKNAVDGPTAVKLHQVFAAFERDPELHVAVLWGAGGTFCAGADLSKLDNPLHDAGDVGPMGPTRLVLSKPVVAAVEGYAVAGGLELALWCDLRVAASDSVWGVFCRRVGVPLIDGGTVRLVHAVGTSRALDAILTGRALAASEAHSWGLVNTVVPPGQAKDVALELARNIAALPQQCLRADRASVLRTPGMSVEAALKTEFLVSKYAVLGAPDFLSSVQGRFKARL